MAQIHKNQGLVKRKCIATACRVIMMAMKPTRRIILIIIMTNMMMMTCLMGLMNSYSVTMIRSWTHSWCLLIQVNPKSLMFQKKCMMMNHANRSKLSVTLRHRNMSWLITITLMIYKFKEPMCTWLMLLLRVNNLMKKLSLLKLLLTHCANFQIKESKRNYSYLKVP